MALPGDFFDQPSAPSHCVIGSGPAGVSCAQALLQQGAKVIMLDAGIALEPARAELVAQMRQSTPAAWTPRQLAHLKEGMDSGAKGIPLKLIYGSDFPYRECDQHLHPEYDQVALRPSFGLGGFSSVWGAAMLPYLDMDMADWPVKTAQLAEHYAAAAKLTGISARSDDLEKQFPLYAQNPGALQLSRQAQKFLDRLGKNRESLNRAGIHFGQARVAVKTATAHDPGCVYCGLCMYGCPYGYIYNSESTVRQFQQDPNFQYRPDIVVTELQEFDNFVVIRGHGRVNKHPFELKSARVYLAAGVIPTTQILLRSMSLYDQPVLVKDSQYFLMPLALLRSAGDVRAESLHTLSQVFLEIFDQQISPHAIHLQVYSYNDLIGQAVRKFFGPLAGPLELLARQLEKRLLIVQGYLHSDHSARIAVTLRRGTPERLQLKAEFNPHTKPMIHQVVKKLSRHWRQVGAVPLKPMLQIAEPGRGFHSGGTFPMHAQPAPLQSDILGRPHGWHRVHAVDATVLPGIPATTITFSVMANAHRIGWESCKI